MSDSIHIADSQAPLKWEVQLSEPARLDSYLATQAQESRSFVQTQITQGNVLVNGTPTTKTGFKLKSGDNVEASFDYLPPLKAHPVEGPLEILFEDEHLLAINKPQSLVVHPAPGQNDPTLVHYLLHYLNLESFTELCPQRPGIVHRLDKGTSGVIIVAKHRKSLEALSLIFKDRAIQKHYECLVYGKPTLQGTLDSPIGRSQTDRKKMSSLTDKGRSALTTFKRLNQFDRIAHLSVQIFTGRTHQIRVHLSEHNHPIVNDITYGKRAQQSQKNHLSDALQSILASHEHPFLHARKIEFVHPFTNKPLSFSAPRPSIFNQALKLLGEKEHS